MDDYGEDVGWDEAALSPSDEKRDNEVVIQECIQNFVSKDFIMEPDIFNNVRRSVSVKITSLFDIWLTFS